MNIRALAPPETASYNQFFLRGVSEHPEMFRITPEEVKLRPFEVLDNKDRRTLLAQHSDVWMGVASFERDLTRVRRHHVGWLVRMYVAPEFSGKGVGRALVRGIIAVAREVGEIDHVNLTVMTSNARAIALYRSEGFSRFATEPGAVEFDGKFYDEDQMALILQ